MTGHEQQLERRQFAKEVSRETVQQVFDSLGMDISTPQGRQEVRDLISWMRAMQKISKRGGWAALWAVVTLLITGIVYAFLEGAKGFLR